MYRVRLLSVPVLNRVLMMKKIRIYDKPLVLSRNQIYARLQQFEMKHFQTLQDHRNVLRVNSISQPLGKKRYVFIEAFMSELNL